MDRGLHISFNLWWNQQKMDWLCWDFIAISKLSRYFIHLDSIYSITRVHHIRWLFYYWVAAATTCTSYWYIFRAFTAIFSTNFSIRVVSIRLLSPSIRAFGNNKLFSIIFSDYILNIMIRDSIVILLGIHSLLSVPLLSTLWRRGVYDNILARYQLRGLFVVGLMVGYGSIWRTIWGHPTNVFHPRYGGFIMRIVIHDDYLWYPLILHLWVVDSMPLIQRVLRV
jgi:hypothetical protein